MEVAVQVLQLQLQLSFSVFSWLCQALSATNRWRHWYCCCLLDWLCWPPSTISGHCCLFLLKDELVDEWWAKGMRMMMMISVPANRDQIIRRREEGALSTLPATAEAEKKMVVMTL